MCDTGMVVVSTIATVMTLFIIYFLLFSPDLYCNDKEWGGTDTLVYNLVQSREALVCPLVYLLLPDRARLQVESTCDQNQEDTDTQGTKVNLAKCNSTLMNKCGRLSYRVVYLFH